MTITLRSPGMGTCRAFDPDTVQVAWRDEHVVDLHSAGHSPQARRTWRGLGGYERMRFRLLVKRFGRKVDAVRPRESARLMVDRDLSKVGGVVERRQDARPPFGREVDVSDRAVAEQQAKRAVSDHGHARYDRQVVLTHIPMLRQRLDTVQGLAPPCPFPVRQDLVLSEPRPFSDELQRSWLKVTSKDFPVRRD
jgi:hypothetical protein